MTIHVFTHMPPPPSLVSHAAHTLFVPSCLTAQTANGLAAYSPFLPWWPTVLHMQHGISIFPVLMGYQDSENKWVLGFRECVSPKVPIYLGLWHSLHNGLKSTKAQRLKFMFISFLFFKWFKTTHSRPTNILVIPLLFPFLEHYALCGKNITATKQGGLIYFQDRLHLVCSYILWSWLGNPQAETKNEEANAAAAQTIGFANCVSVGRVFLLAILSLLNARFNTTIKSR